LGLPMGVCQKKSPEKRHVKEGSRCCSRTSFCLKTKKKAPKTNKGFSGKKTQNAQKKKNKKNKKKKKKKKKKKTNPNKKKKKTKKKKNKKPHTKNTKPTQKQTKIPTKNTKDKKEKKTPKKPTPQAHKKTILSGHAGTVATLARSFQKVGSEVPILGTCPVSRAHCEQITGGEPHPHN